MIRPNTYKCDTLLGTPADPPPKRSTVVPWLLAVVGLVAAIQCVALYVAGRLLYTWWIQ